MTKKVYTIPSELSARRARDEMRRHNVRHLVVLRNGHIAGVISEHDLGGERGLAPDVEWNVDELLTSKIVVCAPEMSVQRAAALLRDHRIGCLPVVDGKQLVGIITTSDLLGYLASEHRAPPKP